MSNYQKGARGERELISILENRGYVCLRAPASGAGTERELPDVIAGDGSHFIVFEVKRFGSDDYDYISKSEIEDLKYYADNFGAEYYIAVRFDHGDWALLKENDMKETKKNFRCDNFKHYDGKCIDDVCQ